MNVRTRKLLALVAEDVTAEILSVCRESPQTEQDLTERIGAARATIAGEYNFSRHTACSHSA